MVISMITIIMRRSLLLLVLCVTCSAYTNPSDVSALKSLMKQWKNTPPSWQKSKDPCGDRWDGVTCTNSRVTTLKLFSMGLEGTLSDDIGKLDQLQILDLSYNHKLGGPLTPAIGNLPQLTSLILVKCGFTGTIPDELGNLRQLTFLALNSNKFTGRIPASLGKLSNVSWLDLADNQLNGSLPMSTNASPGLDQLLNAQHLLSGNPVCSNPHLLNTAFCEIQQETSTPTSSDNVTCSHPYEGVMMFRAPSFGIMLPDFISELESNVSASLNCSPHSLTLKDHFFDEDGYLEVELVICPSNKEYFNRSEILDCFDISSQKYIPPEMFGPYYLSANPYSFQNRVIRGLAIGMIIGFSLLLIGLTALLVFALRQKKQAQRAISLSNPFASWMSNGEESDGAPQLRGAKCFSYDELKRSTNDFRVINEIGSGGYGKVYKGMLPDGRIVAIKRSQQGSNQGGLEFKTEIELLSRVHHKNLVELVGFCCERGELILVYEFMSNGTIRETLSGKSGIQFDWNRRLRIALDSARGLTYLHEHANPPIIHRDVKSSNILLDEKLTAKVGDFGLSLLVADSEMGHFTMHIKGTLGYLDPEYYMTQQLTGKSDVYSFGVVMLELITAMLPVHGKKHIVNHVKIALDKRDKEFCGLKSIIDPVISNSGKLVGFESFVDLALQCVEESADNRPTMSDVVKEIEAILRNNGMKTTSTSESSSPADFRSLKARYPYDDLYSRSHASRSAFEYSGGFPSRGSLRPSTS